jgi:tetraacyldisaccharide 4'-kinase
VATLEAAGATVVGSTWFPDHHDYSPEDVAPVMDAARRADAVVVTTGKDKVKLPPDADIWVIEAEMEPIEGSWRGLWRLLPGLSA